MITTRLNTIENETVEYKKSTSELKAGIISIASILNKHNKGSLYFGIKNNGEIIGQQISDKTLREISQGISNFIEPRIYPTITAQIVDNKHIILVEFEGYDTPYSAYGEFRIRIADEDKKIEVKELLKMLKKAAAKDWDKDVSESTLENINVDILKEFVINGNNADRIKYVYTNKNDIINRLNLLKDNKLLNTGEILFSNKARLPLKLGVFATDSKVTINDMDIVYDNFYSVLKRAETYYRNNTKWKVKIPNDWNIPGFRREEIPEIPKDAIREALINSFIHRDYTSRIDNEFCIFKDRIEIFNPGEFNERYEPIDYINGKGTSICRNELLAATVYLGDDIEKFGSGIKRIYDACKEDDVKVEFEKDKAGFRVIFYRKDVELEYVRNFDFDSLTDQEKKIVLFLEEHKSITRKDVEELLNVKERRANAILLILLNKQIIIFAGNSRKSEYRLK